MTYVFYLDRYHLGDPLFLNQLSRDLVGLDAPRLLVHGAGEDGERALEAEGGIPVWRDDILVVGSEAEHQIVERAARDLNRRIAETLSDAGVPSVRLDGASRGLLRRDEEEFARVVDVEWVQELALQGGVPVVAALVPEAGAAMRQLNGGAVAAGLALAMEDAAVVFFSRQTIDSGSSVSLKDLPEEVVPEPDSLAAAVEIGGDVRLSGPRGVRAAGVEAVRVLQ